MKAELARLQHEQLRLHEEAKKASNETSRTQSELDKALQKYNAVETDLNRLRNQYRSLERRLEQLEMDDDYTVVDNMSMSQKQRELTEVSKNYKEVDAEFNSGKKELVELEAQEVEMQEKIRRIAADIESDTRRAARIQESLRRIMDESIRELEVKKEEAEKTAERSKELPTPSSMSSPPDMEQLADTAELDEQYKTLTLKIESAEKVIGRTITLEQLQAFKDSYEASKKQYLELKALNRKLSECLKIRKEKFPIMCHAITMRLKMTFQRLMATRSYHGKLAVDRQKEVINISVATHQKDDNAETVTKSVVQDLKGLSGGERSFTTACFIMALWEIMEAPFRCMDEFDVFMDMINRRVIMDLLVKLATEQYSHNQFIFFTPQGIKELGEREHVQVFEMPKDESPSADEKEEKQVPQFFTVEGVVGPGNFTRYELKFAYPMRIVLQTLEGDADIYFSYTDKSVSYELHTHDASSATCGLDYIDILSNPRPSYLGVYGHPSKDVSSYRLLVMVAPDGTFDEPELIHQ
ncbi:hypothetical protein OSTOST_14890 [Ostertagia ostertagi]